MWWWNRITNVEMLLSEHEKTDDGPHHLVLCPLQQNIRPMNTIAKLN